MREMLTAIIVLIAPWQEDPQLLATLTVDASVEYGHDPVTLLALMWHESRLKPEAESKAGACGITQVMPRYSRWTCDDLKRLQVGVYAGAEALASWDGSLAHYGGGNRPSRRYERAVVRYRGWIYGKFDL